VRQENLNMKLIKRERKIRRKKKISLNIIGTKEKPRISIFRSNKYIYAQAIDDEERKTLVSYCSLNLEKKENNKIKKIEQAKQIGIELAKKMNMKKIKKAVFDRGCYAYHGRVAALAEGLREEGIII